MNDFLHSLRTGKDKRYDRNRSRHDGPSYRSGDRHMTSDRRKRGNYNKSNVAENAYVTIAKLLPQVKALLETIVTERSDFLVLEERRTEAMERIANYLKVIAGDDSQQPEPKQSFELPDDSQADTVASEDVAPESKDPDVSMIEMIQALRAQGLSYDKIAAKLEDEHIPTPSGRGKWRGQSVSKLLKSV